MSFLELHRSSRSSLQGLADTRTTSNAFFSLFFSTSLYHAQIHTSSARFADHALGKLHARAHAWHRFRIPFRGYWSVVNPIHTSYFITMLLLLLHDESNIALRQDSVL